MVVRVAGHRLVLPLDMLAETQRLQPGQVHLRGAHPPMLARRGKLVALYDLGSILGFRAPPQTHDGRIVLVICGPHEQRAALLVDALEDQRPVVIKGLKDSWRSAPGITAATILGDGQVALILDPQEVLTQLCGADGTTALQEAG